jgi:phenylacetate-CoA ligase
MKATDIARKVLPSRLFIPFRQWLYTQVPLEKRMGKDYWSLRAFLQEAQWWDRAVIEQWQLNRLRQIVQHAYDNVPGYRKLYQEVSVKPEDIVTLNDVRLLPFTTKELLRDNLNDFTARNIPSWQRKYVTTGGSTGIPFGFYHTDTNVWMENAFIHSGWNWVGWNIDQTVAVLRGAFTGSRSAVAAYDAGYRQLLLSSYHISSETYEQYRKAILQWRPKHLHAYPSTATLLADFVLEHDDVGRIVFDSILLGSENVYEWQAQKTEIGVP